MGRLLIKGGLIVTYINEAYETLRMMEGDIFIEEGMIRTIGRDLVGEGVVLDARGKLVLPGFINAHHHSLAPLLSKGLVEGHNLRRRGSPKKLMSSIMDVALSILSEEELKALFQLAARGLIAGGTTTVLESCSLEESERFVSLFQGKHLRSIVAPTLLPLGVSQDLESKREKVVQNLDEIVRLQGLCPGSEWRDIDIWVGFHSESICDQELLRHIRNETMRSGLRITVNLPETEAEAKDFGNRHGRSPVQCLSESELLGPNLLLSHCFSSSEDDRLRLEETGTHLVHCARASVESGRIVPFFPRCSGEINVAIGTDQCSSDMFDELKTVALVGKIGLSAEKMARATDVFYGATVGGAKALGRHDLGRIVEGFKADLLIFDTMNSRLRPIPFPLINTISYGFSSDIEMVIIEGEVVKQRQKTFGVEEEAVLQEAERAIEKVWVRARGLGIF